MPSKRELLGLLLLCPVCALGLPDEDRLLSAAEIASVDRENAMWHLVRLEADAATNLRRLRDRGFAEEEVGLIQPRLTAIWDVPVERHFGWLSKETIRRIRETDRGFVVRLRAARLYAETGVRAGTGEPEQPEAVGREWQLALRGLLDHRELTEFSLLNSKAARKLARLVKGLAVGSDEFRTLCEWQQAFEEKHGPPEDVTGHSQYVWREAALLEHWARMRGLMGEQRFAVYLSRAHAPFMRMYSVIARMDEAGPSLALDMWWLTREHEIAMSRMRGGDRRNAERMEAEHRVKASALLGPERFAIYEQYRHWVRFGRPF